MSIPICGIFFYQKKRGHGVHSPFSYQLCEEVFFSVDPFYDFEKLDEVREKLSADQTTLNIVDLGAGSLVNNKRQRKVKDIAIHTISSRRKSELLYRLCNFLKIRHCLELGTSLGLNTLYLSRSSERVTTIEGSPDIQRFASELFQAQNRKNIRSLAGHFDDLLPGLLTEMPVPDLIYLDGNHTYDATVRYVKRIHDHASPDTVIVLDDIYWSSGMTKAWREVSDLPGVTLGIDCFYFGLLFFRKEFREKVQLRIWL